MKAYRLLLAIFAACALVACSDDEFLTEKPKSDLTLENGYDNSDQVEATLVSAYSVAYSFFFSGGMGADEFSYKQLGTDVLDGKGSITHYGNYTTSWSSTSSFIKTVWDDYYKMISYCNLVLLKAEEVSWSSDSEKSRVIAEARFLRGLAHLRLAELYGGVPIVSEFSETSRFDYTRDTREAVYEFAIEEMKAAYEALPEKSENGDYGRANKGAAGLFLAEACLALGVESGDTSHYSEAATYAQAVIAMHPLMTSRFGLRVPGASGSRNGIANAQEDGSAYSDLFVSDNMTSSANTEAIWIAPAAPDYSTFAANGNNGNRTITLSMTPSLQDMSLDPSIDEGQGKPFSEHVSATYGGQASPYIHGGTGWGQTPITWFASYDVWDADHNFGSSTDNRYDEGVTVRTKFLVINENLSIFEQYIGWDEINKATVNEGSMFFPIFYKETPMDGWDWDTVNPNWAWYWTVSRACLYRNKYIARSADAYLLLAEAKYRQGDSGSALSVLNELRARSGAEAATDIDMQVILDERVRELMLEENRWATLLRMKADEWQPRLLNYGTYTATSSDKVYPEVRRWAEYTDRSINFTNWPIPQTYIDLNTGADFPQNQGW